jgi:hypothetical protein
MQVTQPVRQNRAFGSTLQFNGASQLGFQRLQPENPVTQLYKASLPQQHKWLSQQAEQQKHQSRQYINHQQHQQIQQHQMGTQLNVGGKQQQADYVKLQAQADYHLKALKKQQELPRPGLIFVAFSDLAKQMWRISTRRTQKQASEKQAALARSEVKTSPTTLDHLG